LPGELVEKFDFKNRVPLKRVGEHQELANLAAFLISDFAAFHSVQNLRKVFKF
jgi:NAD(P)-dependent dehydrogenase (short-subunit alcohol dehydrogenase family)